MTFVLVGGGPTGVEMAGSIAELTRHTLVEDFRKIDTREARIILLEGTGRVLPSYTEILSKHAKETLKTIGVDVRTDTILKDIQGERLTVKSKNGLEKIQASVVLWTAGVQASPLGKILEKKAGATLDRAGRVTVTPEFTVPGHPEIFVIGDLALYQQGANILPGVAWVAMQEGGYVADVLTRRAKKIPAKPFRFKDKGSLAVIGRNKAVASVMGINFTGFLAWLLWAFVHIHYLIEFNNKLLVLFQWASNYVTQKRGARLITKRD